MTKLNDIQALVDRDVDVLLHPASSITVLKEQGPDMIVSAEGSNVVDHNGQQLLDAVAGLWCVNVGYGRKELADAMSEAAQQLSYYHTFSSASNPWQVALAEKLVSIAPSHMKKVFFGSSGSDANDTIVKIAWHYHALKGNENKVKVIAREQAYHGTSISTASLTGLGGFHKKYPIPLDFVVRIECPHYYTRGLEGETEAQFCDRLIAELETTIEREGADSIAAFIAEPMMAAGGVITPPKGYFEKLQPILKRHNILMIADEVVCGYGRLGHWFGSEIFNISPDLIATAKGLTSGYFPMSAVLLTDEIWSVLEQGSAELGAFSHGYTYSGHPIGAAVALRNLEIIESEGLVDVARVNGQYLHEQLATALKDHPLVGEIRGFGLIAGIQLVKDKATKLIPEPAEKWPAKVASECRKQGVIVRPLPSVGTLAISPPLVITRAEIDVLVSTLKQSIDTLL